MAQTPNSVNSNDNKDVTLLLTDGEMADGKAAFSPYRTKYNLCHMNQQSDFLVFNHFEINWNFTSSSKRALTFVFTIAKTQKQARCLSVGD